MNSDSIVLRPAKPTLDDGMVFARYADEAAEGFNSFILGRHAESIVANIFIQPDHDLSYQNVIFAERDNIIVGMVAAYSAEQHRLFSRQLLKRAAGRFNLRFRIVQFLFSPLFRIADSTADGDFYIHAIAVNSELRGDGVGSVFMRACEERAREHGSTRLSLDVSAKNEKALRFYERQGLSIESQWPKRLSIPGLKIYRMVKRL